MLAISDLTKLARALSEIELIQEIDRLQVEIDSNRPISKEIQDRIFQKFRLEWNYNSNAIEGNSLTYGETVALIMHGVTAKGKPLKDHLDVKGHNKGINLLLDIVKSERDFTQNDIRSLHEIILVEPYSSRTITLDGIPATRQIQIGQYKTVPNHVKTVTGEMHYYATPEETPILMDEVMTWYESAKKDDQIHPFVLASLFHHRFVSIHPFDDGNGRMTRILMNLILMRYQYPPIVVPLKFRKEYYGVLSEADNNEFLPMIEYFGGLLKKSLSIQLKGIKGENISDPDDIDKEIELLKRSLPKKDKLTKVK
ncbi:MAG: Fic family protein, partial [Bacteroidota bacterium]